MSRAEDRNQEPEARIKLAKSGNTGAAGETMVVWERNARGIEGLTMAARNFRDLLVWRKAHEMVLGVYRVAGALPGSETYALSLQMRRAAVSVTANIAEGFARRSKAEKLRFMNVAEGSLEEVRNYLILAEDLGWGSSADIVPVLEETSRLLCAYGRAIRNSIRD